MSLFLSKNELQEFTGTKLREKQRAWLAQHRYKFDVNHSGEIIVLRSHVVQKLSDYSGYEGAKTKPNAKALKERMGV